MADDDVFLDHVVGRLAGLPAVEAVTLGGSRAHCPDGPPRPDTDWDLGVYYRGRFDPDALRALGWPGEVSEIGGWGGGVFNGGAWLTVDGRRVDVHYRDLDVVERELDEARAGRFRIEPLMFHLAGIPSYLVVAELALSRVLHGSVPRPEGYPEPLRRTARQEWRARADLTLDYARYNNAPRGGSTEVAGGIAIAAMETAHAVLAARGTWVTNEKRLLAQAGLRSVDTVFAGLDTAPDTLGKAVEDARALFHAALPEED